MTRTVVILVCFSFNLISVTSLLERRSEQGRLNCVSFSEPIFRTSSRSMQSPFFITTKPFISVFFNEAPVKPRTDAIYTPEPIEITDTSPILHKVHKATKDPTEDEEDTEGNFTKESSEEKLPIEYDYFDKYYNDEEIDERDDIGDTPSDEKYVENTENKPSGEEHDVNTSEEEIDTSHEENETNRGPVLFP